MKLKYRVLTIIIIYLAIILAGVIVSDKLNKEISPAVFENPTLTVQTFLDDFISVRISCYWPDSKQVNFLVLDEFGNIRHNSSVHLNCSGYKELNLQGQPQDYESERMYRLEATFDNQTISSGYFYLSNNTRKELIKKELFSWSYFMIYQSRLARGSYSDDQRLLYMSTGDKTYAQNFILAHALGIISTFTIIFSIDIAIWIGYWIYKASKTKKKIDILERQV